MVVATYAEHAKRARNVSKMGLAKQSVVRVMRIAQLEQPAICRPPPVAVYLNAMASSAVITAVVGLAERALGVANVLRRVPAAAGDLRCCYYLFGGVHTGWNRYL